MKLLHTGIALLIAFLTGLLPVAHKYLLGKYNPFSLMIFSSIIYFLAVICLAFTQTNNLKKDFKLLTRTDAVILILSMVVCGFSANVLYYLILKTNKSYVVSSIMHTAPFFTLIVALLFLNEHISPTGILGVFCTIIGVVLITMNDYDSHKNNSMVT